MLQAIKFLITSGVGWIIDFFVFTILTRFFSIEVIYANIISSIPAITFVFFVSVKKTFVVRRKKFRLKDKYLIYVAYQIILVLCISYIAQELYLALREMATFRQTVIYSNLSIITKILITPITMITNFFIMKLIIEKI